MRHLTCWQHADDFKWRWALRPKRRPLFGLDRLAHPINQAVVCDDEHAAMAAAAWQPDCTAVSWPGGRREVSRTDWLPLRYREVLQWPSASAHKQAAMTAVLRQAISWGAGKVYWVCSATLGTRLNSRPPMDPLRLSTLRGVGTYQFRLALVAATLLRHVK